ncbi:MAG: SDR family oxidoreductase [Bacteroidetes bacterium]|nr:SDR family oxidoreductase [Bacteroidota bacterium]
MNIVLTGASRGIGYELVIRFLQLHHRVIAASRNVAPLELLAQSNFQGNLIPLQLDLEQPGFEHLLRQTVEAHFGQLDLLVNNAGLLINKPFEQLDERDFDRLFQVNTKAPFTITRTLLNQLSSGAHILNIASMGGFQGSAKFPGLSLYSASKGALAILTECLAEELRPKGIKVNCLAPGAAQTEMLNEAFPGYQAPLSAGEMADFVAWFAINGHKYFNGKILPVSLSTP